MHAGGMVGSLEYTMVDVDQPTGPRGLWTACGRWATLSPFHPLQVMTGTRISN